MNPFYKNMALWIVIILMMLMLYSLFNPQNIAETSISYTDFLAMVEDERVTDVVMQGQELYVTDINKKHYKVYTPQDSNLIANLRQKGVVINAKPPRENPWYMSMLISWFPILILIGVWVFFMRQMQSGGGKAMSFGKSRARLLSDQLAKVTFEDVAGIDEAKEELGEIVEFLSEPKKFTRLGGRIPKGVLLMGSPGTGKTLLARAIAGEADVPFFSISGSDFVEMFVGVGASRVRDLFVQGKKNAPCIIFIDEIDAVGRHRGAGLGGGHDEREQTLNQLLVEMDGFESNEGVILISATNRPDVLDPALLRPGRFDRQVVVPLPDIKGREKILKVHLKKTPVGEDVKPVILAKGTPGFSGADLENLVNEAALLAAKRSKEKVSMEDLEDAKDKVYMGLERKSKVIREEDRKTTAYHEAGHALVARFLPNTDPVNKITIIPRGRAAGVTWFLPEERDFKYKDQLESELAVAFGGRVAEEVVFDRISTGASNDIKQATDLAQQMVRTWGMSAELGPMSYAKGEEQVFLGREIAQHRDYSDETALKIDNEIAKLIHNAYERARQILDENMDLLHQLADLLLENETVLGNELDALILKKRPEFDFPSKLDEDLVPDKEEPKAESPAEDESPAETGGRPDEAPETTPPVDRPEADENPDDEPKEQTVMQSYTLEWPGHCIALGERTCVMGILNTTPDSFSDGGRFLNHEDALAQGEELVAAGADILDIGGESTRPFSAGVSAEEEIRRVLPVIETLAARIPIPISIDTTKAAVAKRAVDAGAAIINDISALRQDPAMASVAATCGVPVVLMHMLGTPRTMQVDPAYNDLFGEIGNFLATAIKKAVESGIDRNLLIADPGIGFGKTVAHNLLLVKHMDVFKTLNVPLLIGPSRKAFIRTILQEDSDREVTPDLPEVAVGTQTAVAAAVLSGAHIVRVHDVAATRATVALADALRRV